MENLGNPVNFILAFAVLIGGLGLLVRVTITMIHRASEEERKAREKLEVELRSDIKTEREERSKATFRIKELEEKRIADLALIEGQKAKIEELTQQVGTLLNQMAALQETVKTLKTELDSERRENERLVKDNHRLEKLNADLFEQARDRQIENKAFREALVLLGMKLSDDRTDPPKTPNSEIAPEKRIA